MTAFTSTRAGALYVVDQVNAVIANENYERDCSAYEWLGPIFDPDRYDELVAYVQDIVNQYTEVNGVSDDDDEQFEVEANAIAYYLQGARLKVALS